jgi:membrane protein DedA with SNARE-associated domain/rhodanese-related sulfurtransferase
MPNLMFLLQTHGVLLVFLAVLVEQMGLPVPAYPVLIVAGAMVMQGKFSWAACALVALLACMLSDQFWFQAGRWRGKQVLRLLCKISLSPDYCVSQTENKFRRWGAKSLLVSKFVPGFNTIAPPVAGASGISRGRFMLFSALGSLLWIHGALGMGALFHRSIDRILDAMSVMGSTALLVLGVLLGLFILFKFIERQRFYRALRVPRVSINEMQQMMAASVKPVLLDVRSPLAVELDEPIPGARLLGDLPPAQVLADVAKNHPVIVYCSCPNDVSAAKMAKELIGHGFLKVRPLKGGLEAWNMAQAHTDQAPHAGLGAV